jgi:hypothetical protein
MSHLAVRPLIGPLSTRWAVVGAASLLTLLLAAGPAQAQSNLAPQLGRGAPSSLPEVPDPQAWARLSPVEQERRRLQIKQQLQDAAPEQRQAYRRALRERLESLSPEQRQALAGQLRLQWGQLPPEERERLQQERREAIQAMAPEERRALLRERRAMLDKLSPEERRALAEKLPTS